MSPTLQSGETTSTASHPAGSKDAVPTQPAVSFPVVGIGASAGGLEAFNAFLKALPADTGMAFVLIQHMDPKHESVLTALLQRATAMPVREVVDGMAVEANHVYVIPPNALMTISKGVLALAPRNPNSLRNLPIDHFLCSLADDLGSSAIGVILSGTASDGTQGLRAIKAQGGIAFAQDPESAQHKSMPLSAVTAGCVDFVLPPQRIATELAQLNGHPYLRPAPAVEDPLPSEGGEEGIRKICTLLRTASGVDFRLYKPATINRRIARRMALRKLELPEQYAQLLIHDRTELNALYDDIFIHVTGFFRDPETMQALQEAVFARILSRKEPEHIRVWVPGCSTGEEVYTIAMLLVEQIADRRSQFTLQIFGTDISDRAIEHARAGIYAESSMVEVSVERQKRFFGRTDGGFQIAKPLRDICIFARHDLARDPPFSNLDLISCRNVLIYMGPVLQKRVAEAFHYALRPEGHLLLGRSESLSSYSHLFSAEDSRHKIFSRRPFSSPLRLSTPMGIRPETEPVTAKGASSTAMHDSRREAEQVILDQYAPPGLVVDPRLQIIHFQGNTRPFLQPATGEPSFHLLRMVRPELVVDLRTAIHQARKNDAEVRRSVRLKQNGGFESVDIHVRPLKGEGGKAPDFLVIFQTMPAPEPANAAEQPLRTGSRARAHASEEIALRDRELASMREQLRAMIHDHEAANEEMRAMNEEVLSSNEELQSTNEELETAKEELESSNEELTTLNDELQQRNAELTHLTDDLSNLLTGVNIPILFLDISLRIRRFTPLAGKVLNLIATDVGRPLTDIAATLEVADWSEMASRAIQRSEVVEREVRDREGHWYALRMRPYKTSEERIDGVLVALLDIDAVKRSLDEAREARDFAEAIVETVREPLLVLDAGLRVVRATGSFYETFEASRDDTEGQVFFELGGGQWNIAQLRTLLEEILPRDSRFEGFEMEHDFPAIGYRRMILNARQIRRAAGGSPMILLAIEDITDRARSDIARLAAARDEERRRIARELHDDLVQRLAGVAMELGGHAPKPARAPLHEKETREIQRRVVEAAEVARRIAYQLHPSEVEDLGLEGALRAYCESFSQEHDINVGFTSRDLPEELKAEIASCLYRVAQESLNNVMKHAKAQSATVVLEGTATLIRLLVEDQGVGFAASSRHDGDGLGIVSMKERVRLAGGKFSITSAPGTGTRVLVEVPL